MLRKKAVVAPVWWKNTYFLIAAILVVVAIVGLPVFGGDRAIRDPGQKRESGLWLYYVVAAVVMLIGGVLSHAQAVRTYDEERAKAS